MKKLIIAMTLLLMAIPLSFYTEAHAASKEQLDINVNNVNAYKNGTISIENIKIGDKISKIKSKYPNLMYSYSNEGKEKENYYEFNTDKGHMIVTSTGSSNKEKVKRITMIYDKLTNVELDHLVKVLGENTTKRVQNNKYTGGYAYVNNSKAHFQLSKSTPKSKVFKVYRIDIGKY